MKQIFWFREETRNDVQNTKHWAQISRPILLADSININQYKLNRNIFVENFFPNHKLLCSAKMISCQNCTKNDTSPSAATPRAMFDLWATSLNPIAIDISRSMQLKTNQNIRF